MWVLLVCYSTGGSILPPVFFTNCLSISQNSTPILSLLHPSQLALPLMQVSLPSPLYRPQLLDADILGHQSRVDDIMAQIQAFRDANHFLIVQIEDRGQELVRR